MRKLLLLLIATLLSGCAASPFHGDSVQPGTPRDAVVVQRAHPGMEFVNAPNDRN